MTYGKTVRDELRVPTRELRHAIPQVYAGYAVGKECDGCIAAHAHAAVQHGASPQEAAEAIGVTFLMNGGPATVYGRGRSPPSRSSARSGSARATVYRPAIEPVTAIGYRAGYRPGGHAAKNWPIPRLSSAVSTNPLRSRSSRLNARSASSALVP